jgi:hypothetical protein
LIGDFCEEGFFLSGGRGDCELGTMEKGGIMEAQKLQNDFKD